MRKKCQVPIIIKKTKEKNPNENVEKYNKTTIKEQKVAILLTKYSVCDKIHLQIFLLKRTRYEIYKGYI